MFVNLKPSHNFHLITKRCVNEMKLIIIVRIYVVILSVSCLEKVLFTGIWTVMLLAHTFMHTFCYEKLC